ncbi:ABC transporter multidrug-family ATP-binding/permease [[Clostridium] sordellii]|uniref:ABC-type transport system, multidrug-family ATP-binding/permease n=1 Tax=Paraclostridium sordellii TaxID=1505 RepID=A0ABM9RMW0_PARSO|nr:ABC transporter ATP-binding protein [Paeniclostridium sordellii]CEJ73374.1 ABC-type transport system, multidrug-family ATP-binding/permease [[Clostridium] sordellii] [Paeniclostridium sordellii]CEN68927.1 ABC transporter multidrug-family ATP-binding/permease [[Clostridium] sordellii] [Paeniclostridium sordellii]CEN72194.1 ABC transporter multidrug-family ATP-binding/permease [[Clostridium] sordellii] [Paeniclostridium sordellii]CEO23343.1 ABC transporter multidrug-family ATP-binding/permease
MIKLIKHLRNSIGSVLLIVVLLAIQATCDLSLPDYTSDIVNVGIQQSGIENAVPKVIRESQMNNLTLFMSKSDKDEVMKYYTLLNKGEYKDSNVDEKLYELNTKDKSVIDNLDPIMAKSMMIASGIEQNKTQILKKITPPGVPVNKNTDVMSVLRTMPTEALDNMKSSVEEKISKMPESMVSQSAIRYVKAEYKAIGMNVDKLQTNYIFKAGAIMLGIALISMVATVAVGYLGARVAAKLGRNLRKQVFGKVVSFSNKEMDEFSTASLITRSTNDIQQVQMLMVMLLRIVFYAPILAIGGFIKVLNTNTSMAWIIGVAVLAILSVVLVLFGLVMPKFKSVQKLVDKVNLVTREMLTGMLVIRAFSTEKHEEKRFDKANTDLMKTNLFVNRAMSMMMPTMMLIMNVITVVIVWNGAHSVDSGSMQVGDMMAFIQYTMQIIMAFLMISMVSMILPRAVVSMGRIDEVISTDLVIKDKKETKSFDENKKGIVEFKNVSFRYPNAEEDVLSNITFTAKPGQTTAFIGSTGSGKSTLINLIPRFYDVTEGEILVDGVNVKDVTQHELREKIGYVPQKGVLFSGTINSNLRYGKKDVSEETVRKAAEIAQASEFIDVKPKKFETEISQGGTNVSGGQKQRLSIARAIAKNPEIYIFDDSFSALDLKTDAALRKSLNEETGDSTVLIVAQRISTIINADQIVVLDQGKVVGIGTHKELLKICEVYNEIALSQLSKEELANG